MDSYRLKINNYDLSAEVVTSDPQDPIGYTVVRSPKGKMTPTLVTSTAEYDALVGTPGKEYPTVYEGRAFVANGFPLYVSAPYNEKNTTMPFAIITKKGQAKVSTNPMKYRHQLEDYVAGDVDDLEGGETLEDLFGTAGEDNTFLEVGIDNTVSFVNKDKNSDTKVLKIITTLTDNSESENPYAQLIKDKTEEGSIYKTYRLSGLSGGSTSYVTLTLNMDTDTSIKIKVGEVEVGEVTVENRYIVFALEGNNDEGSVLTTNIIKASGISESARSKISLNEEVKVEDSDILAYIFPKVPTEEDIKISFATFKSMGSFGEDDHPEREAKYRNSLVMTLNDSSSFKGSLDYGYSSDALYKGFSEVNEDYASNSIVSVYTTGYFDEKVDISGDTLSSYGTITLSGGKRDIEDKTADGESKTEAVDIMGLGWQQAQEDVYSNVKVFFDSERHLYETSEKITADINEDFLGLSEIHPLSGYIYNYTIPKSLVGEAPVLNYGARYWNICNERKASLSNTSGDNIWSPMTGSRAAMQCRIIRDGYGGIAPMYLNSNEMGGQLNVDGNSSLHYNYSAADQKKLDGKNYNPVIKDNTYGIMVVGQKTSKAGATTDWSYIGHVCSFLLLEDEIRTNVMIPQLGKANNPYYRDLRASQVSQLLRPRLEGNNSIWSWADVDTSTNTGCNDEYAQKEKKFVINVRVKPYPYSEIVELNFTNYSDSTSVSSNME